MRYVVLVILLIIAYIFCSFYILASFRLYGTSMKSMMLAYLAYPGVPSEEYYEESSGDEETGLSHIHPECSTWASMGEFLMDMVEETTTLAQNVNKRTEDTMDRLSNFVFEIEIVLDDFREKVESFLPKISEGKGKVAEAMKEACDYLVEMYSSVQQRSRYVGMSIVASNRKFVLKIHDQMGAMFQGLYEKVVRNATASSIRECTCELLLRVDVFQRNNLPGVKDCAEVYAIQTIKSLNSTAYDLLSASEYTIDNLAQLQSSMKLGDLNEYLTTEVS